METGVRWRARKAKLRFDRFDSNFNLLEPREYSLKKSIFPFNFLQLFS